MHLVIDLKTGQIVRRASNAQKAYELAQLLTEQWSWIDGRQFNCQPA